MCEHSVVFTINYSDYFYPFPVGFSFSILFVSLFVSCVLLNSDKEKSFAKLEIYTHMIAAISAHMVKLVECIVILL